MSDFPPHIVAIIEDFKLFDDWEDKYGYLIDLGKQLPPLDDIYKTDQYKVAGCTSQVWMVANGDNSEIFKFSADSDSFIVKGLIALLTKIYNNQPTDIIKQIDIKALFKELGLESHLSPNRSNGFFAMTNRIIELAK